MLTIFFPYFPFPPPLTMSTAFRQANAFNGDLSKWKTSAVTNLKGSKWK